MSNDELKHMTREDIASELMYDDEYLEDYEALTQADVILNNLEELSCGTE